MANKITKGSKAADKKAAKPKPKAPAKKAAPKVEAVELTAVEHIEKAIELVGKEKIYAKGNSTDQVIHGLTRTLDKLKRLKQMV
jgi:ribosomal protein L35AE/L33A